MKQLEQNLIMICVWMWLMLLIAAIVSCNRGNIDKRDTTVTKPDLGWIRERAELYLSLAPTIQHEAGFIYTAKCDALTWSGYLSAAGGKVDLTAATDGDGKWYRRPLSLPECYASGESQSTISKDGLLATWWAFVLNGVKGEMPKQADYLKAHLGFGGEGRLRGADTYIPLKHIDTLQQAIRKVDGGTASQRGIQSAGGEVTQDTLAYISQPCQGNYDCFQQGSLTLLRLYLYGTTTVGDVSNALVASSKWVDNPLWYVIYCLADGAPIDGAYLQTKTSDWARYPTDRLPTGEETCDEFSMQRPVNQVCLGDTTPRAGLELIWLTRLIDVFYP